MRRVAGLALTFASLFLSLMAILIDAPALFYMSFALIATLIASNIQSTLATRSLRIERIAPETSPVGELASIELILWSQRRIRRPLVTIQDDLPGRMMAVDISPSLPVAPAYDQPIRTRYQFRPRKRGLYRLNRVRVTGTDALGLVVKSHIYETPPAEILITPTPIPVEVELPSGAGFGASEAQSGSLRGAGIEPRGLRSYVYGDSLRYVDWRSSARTGSLQVKEFEAGTHGVAAFIIAATPRMDPAGIIPTPVDAMFGHALFLSGEMMRQGVRVLFPEFEERVSATQDADRLAEVAALLGRATISTEPILSRVEKALATIPSGATVIILAAEDDGSLEEAIRRARSGSPPVLLSYNPQDFGLAQADDLTDLRLRTEDFRRLGAHVVFMPGIGGGSNSDRRGTKEHEGRKR